jgi:hypothetical protein
VFFGQPIWLPQVNAVLWAKPFMVPAPTIWGLAYLRQGLRKCGDDGERRLARLLQKSTEEHNNPISVTACDRIIQKLLLDLAGISVGTSLQHVSGNMPPSSLAG